MLAEYDLCLTPLYKNMFLVITFELKHIVVWWLSVTIVTMVDISAIFGIMISCDLTFKFSLGATLKKSNMAAIFKMAARHLK